MAQLGPDKALIFRVTHVQNVPWILRHGMHCQSSGQKDPSFVPIGLADLIDKRRARRVELAPGGTLADYVPFYFTPFSMMMYNIKTGYNGVTKRANREIAVFVSSLPKLAALGVPFLFTNGHAYPVETDYFNDLRDLNRIDWDLLNSRNFTRDPEDPGRQTRYQAEALVHRHVPVGALLGIACHDDVAREHLAGEAVKCGAKIDVKTAPTFYF